MLRVNKNGRGVNKPGSFSVPLAVNANENVRAGLRLSICLKGSGERCSPRALLTEEETVVLYRPGYILLKRPLSNKSWLSAHPGPFTKPFEGQEFQRRSRPSSPGRLPSLTGISKHSLTCHRNSRRTKLCSFGLLDLLPIRLWFRSGQSHVNQLWLTARPLTCSEAPSRFAAVNARLRRRPAIFARRTTSGSSRAARPR